MSRTGVYLIRVLLLLDIISSRTTHASVITIPGSCSFAALLDPNDPTCNFPSFCRNNANVPVEEATVTCTSNNNSNRRWKVEYLAAEPICLPDIGNPQNNNANGPGADLIGNGVPIFWGVPARQPTPQFCVRRQTDFQFHRQGNRNFSLVRVVQMERYRYTDNGSGRNSSSSLRAVWEPQAACPRGVLDYAFGQASSSSLFEYCHETCPQRLTVDGEQCPQLSCESCGTGEVTIGIPGNGNYHPLASIECQPAGWFPQTCEHDRSYGDWNYDNIFKFLQRASPTETPTTVPLIEPTAQPSLHPTNRPSGEPTTMAPSQLPSSVPTELPSAAPTDSPSFPPSSTPSNRPTIKPSAAPSSRPSMGPSAISSSHPTAVLSTTPSSWPTAGPSTLPTTVPTREPSIVSSTEPSPAPTVQPSLLPTVQPSHLPTVQPSHLPTVQPSLSPTVQPSLLPTVQPSVPPTRLPSPSPSAHPTLAPSAAPSIHPTVLPGNPTRAPVASPSQNPTASNEPSRIPSVLPTTSQPSSQPTTTAPSTTPSTVPTTTAPSTSPSVAPTTVAPSTTPSTVSTTTAPSTMPSAAETPSRVPSPVIRIDVGPVEEPIGQNTVSFPPTVLDVDNRVGDTDDQPFFVGAGEEISPVFLQSSAWQCGPPSLLLSLVLAATVWTSMG